MSERSFTLPLFVYGTLRPGMGLYSEIAGSVVSYEPASIEGRMYHVGDRAPGPFPVVDVEEEGTIRGDLLWIALTDEVIAICDMEIRSGYTIRRVDATTNNGQVQAHVFHFPWRAGPRVLGGDWKAEVMGGVALPR